MKVLLYPFVLKFMLKDECIGIPLQTKIYTSAPTSENLPSDMCVHIDSYQYALFG